MGGWMPPRSASVASAAPGTDPVDRTGPGPGVVRGGHWPARGATVHRFRPGRRAQRRRRAVVAIVISPRGRRRDGIPRWVFPGGTIEEGETAQKAAVRECTEETGLVVSAEDQIGRRTQPTARDDRPHPGGRDLHLTCGTLRSGSG